MIRLILSTKNDDFIKECAEDESLWNYENDRIDFIIDYGNESYIKECIESSKFSSFFSLKLIGAFGEKYGVLNGENILEFINSNNIKLDEETKKLIKLLIVDKDFIKNNIDVSLAKDFKLPEEMTIGMEIESEGFLSEAILCYFNFNGWESKGDGSLEDGVEVISPILHPVRKDAEEVYIVNDVLNRLEQDVSENCAAHVHIGSDYLTSKQAYINLIEIWCNTEKILYAISNEKYTAPRWLIEKYAQPFAPKVKEALEKGSINLTDEEDLDKFVLGLQSVQAGRDLSQIDDPEELKKALHDGRYSGLNLMNINNGKNTIEFRVANGTLNPDLWMDNINLFGGIIAISEELAKIQQRGIKCKEDKRKIKLLNSLTNNLTDDKKLEVLLELLGLDPEPYRARFNSNIKLIDNDKFLSEIFNGVNEPIKLFYKKNKGKRMKKVMKNSNEKCSALSQQDAVKNLTDEMKRQLQPEITKEH